jgi:PHD/YefM family antitoxin component YafN of YafNO toxin-antitoxin module
LTWQPLSISTVYVKTTDLTITELATSAPKAVRETEEVGIRGITRNGKAVAFLVSRAVMESILETMELQKNPRLMELLKADKAGRIAFTPVPNEG